MKDVLKRTLHVLSVPIVIPVAMTGVILYNAGLMLHNILVLPVVYIATGEVVYTEKQIKKFYSKRAKVTPVTSS